MSTPPLLVTDYPANGVARITFNRPQAHNALSQALMEQLCNQLESWCADDAIRAVIITGGDAKAFAAGADIKELASTTVPDALKADPLTGWDKVAAFPKPIISAVNGIALGGGFELVMATDIIVAAESASFGLPELNLGVIPGAGGTQRLTKALGKHRAMAMILTGDRLSAEQAFQVGLVHQVVPVDQLQTTVVALAATIAAKPMLAVMAAKKAVLAAQEHPLSVGVQTERAVFYQLFATHDGQEGMRAFLEKRPPQFLHR